jgi:dUTP pyrophosphatase
MPKVKQTKERKNARANRQRNTQSSVHFCKFDENAQVPTKGHDDDAGYDLASIEEIIISPGKTKLVSTGLGFTPPRGYYGQLFSRSGLAAKEGIFVQGGVIDRGYRGVVKVILYNSSENKFQVNAGDRIAQIIFLPVLASSMVEVPELPVSERNDHGFGSTGENQADASREESRRGRSRNTKKTLLLENQAAQNNFILQNYSKSPMSGNPKVLSDVAF